MVYIGVGLLKGFFTCGVLMNLFYDSEDVEFQ